MTRRTRTDTLDTLNATYEKANATVDMALEQAMVQFKLGNPRAAQEATKAAQAASVSMGIARTKMHELEDRPPEPVDITTFDPRAACRDLARRFGITVQSTPWPEPGPTDSGQPQHSLSPPPARSPTRSLPSPPSQRSLSPGTTLSVDLAAIAKDLDDLTFDAKQRRNGQWMRIPGTHTATDDTAVELVHRLTEHRTT